MQAPQDGRSGCLPVCAARQTGRYRNDRLIGDRHEDRPRVHDRRQGALRRDSVHHHRLRDPQPRRQRRLPSRERRGAARLEPGGLRRHRAKVLPQGRGPGAAQEGSRGGRARVPMALGARRAGARGPARGSALRRRDQRPPGLRPARRRVGVLGLQGRLFLLRRGRAGLLRRDALHARAADGGAELAAMVQHRAALGLRDRRAGASWTSGCARRGSSSTARGPAPTSRRCAPRAKPCRAAAAPRA